MSKEEFVMCQTHTFKMNIDCDGCNSRVRKVLNKINGVCQVHIEREKVTVEVRPNVDVKLLIKSLSKLGKSVELLNNQNQKQTSVGGNQAKNMAAADVNKGGGANHANKSDGTNTKQPKAGQQGNPNQKQQPQATSNAKNQKVPSQPNQKAVQFAKSKTDYISDDESDDEDDYAEDSDSSITSPTSGKPGSKANNGSIGKKGVASGPGTQVQKMNPNSNPGKKGACDGGNGGSKNDGKGSSGGSGNFNVANPNQNQASGKKGGGGFPPVNGGFPPPVSGGFPPQVNGGLPHNVNGGLPHHVNGGQPSIMAPIGLNMNRPVGSMPNFPAVQGLPAGAMMNQQQHFMAPMMNQPQGPMLGNGPFPPLPPHPAMYDNHNQRPIYLQNFPPPYTYQEPSYSTVFSDENPVGCTVL